MKNFKEEITRINKIINATETAQNLKNTMEFLYERITNRQDKDYNHEYSLGQILSNKVIKKFSKAYNDDSIVIVEIVEYSTAPKECVIIVNIFVNKRQTELEIYV